MRMSNPKLRAAVWYKSNGHCWYCGTLPNPFSQFCIDHFIPKSRKGGDNIDNLVPSCRKCNQMKGNLTIEEFRIKLTQHNINIPKFTNEQIDYLRTINILLPKPKLIKFYYEGL